MDFSRALLTIREMANTLIAAFPDVLLACAIFMLFYFIAKRTRQVVILVTARRQKAKTLGLILGRLAQSGVVTAGVLVALTVLFPSFRPGDLIQLLGIGSVAIGFAFRDIFQNFLAGILLLLTSPFRIGDQIVVDTYEGTVEDIQTRGTTLRTHDGCRVVIPNSDLLTHSVIVNTAFTKRRLEYEVGISYQEDIAEVKTILLQAVNSIDGVLQEPPAEAFVVALAESSVNIRVYWWTKTPHQDSILQLQDKVLTTLKNRLIEHNVDLPFPTHQIILQTQPAVSNGHNVASVAND